MSGVLTYKPNEDKLHSLLLNLASASSQKHLVELVEGQLAGLPGVAAARVWLKRPGDRCRQCPQRSACLDRTVCFHAAGGTLLEGAGEHIRIPLNLPLAKKAAEEPVHLEPPQSLEGWIADSGWLEEERILAFAAHPIGRMGVLGVATRIPLGAETRRWLGWIANHLAAGLARTRVQPTALPGGTAHADHPTPSFRTSSEMRELERRNLMAALRASGGKVFGPRGAAELLEMKPTTLASRIKALGITRTALTRGDLPADEDAPPLSTGN